MKTAPVARAEGGRARAAFPGGAFCIDSLLNTSHSSAAAASEAQDEAQTGTEAGNNHQTDQG